jgi:hypothetical protein
VRAWAFSLDGHVFYVLPDVAGNTYVCDLTTGQWHHWYTGSEPGKWVMERGMAWEGRTLGAAAGALIFELDPSSMVDPGDEQIRRVVTGFLPLRGRNSVPMGSLRVTATVGDPSAEDAEILLRFSDDEGETWSPAYRRVISAGDFAQVLRFRSLGRVRAPGRILEVEDTGGVVTIEGVDSDLGEA